MTPESATPSKNALEWLVFGLSLILVLATLGLLVWTGFQTPEGPARLRVVTGPAQVEAGWVSVPVTVMNRGGEGAEGVEVRVTFGSGEAAREVGFTLDFVPRDSDRSGMVTFPGSVADGEVTGRIVGSR